jgi:hypothetical protein
MKINSRNVSAVFLILGMVFLAVGVSTHNKVFTWAAIAFIVIALAAGGRRVKPGRKQ